MEQKGFEIVVDSIVDCPVRNPKYCRYTISERRSVPGSEEDRPPKQCRQTQRQLAPRRLKGYWWCEVRENLKKRSS